MYVKHTSLRQAAQEVKVKKEQDSKNRMERNDEREDDERKPWGHRAVTCSCVY